LAESLLQTLFQGRSVAVKALTPERARKTADGKLATEIKKTDDELQIVWAPGYSVTADGRVWSYHRKNGKGLKETPHTLKPVVQGNGYRHVTLHVNGKRLQVAVHRLILEVFVGACPPGMQCRHLNGLAAGDGVANLAWGTCVEQAEDREAHGTKLRGSKIGNAVLSEDLVATLRKEHVPFDRKHSLSVLAKKYYGVAKGTVADAVSGRYWKGEGHAA
jgi:hypothetical protein